MNSDTTKCDLDIQSMQHLFQLASMPTAKYDTIMKTIDRTGSSIW